MAQETFNLIPPLAGLNKKSAYKQKPPYATPDCQNVRVTDQLQQRERLGSRPGTRKAFYEELGSGSPINMLENINVVTPNSLRIWSDWFNAHTIDSIWSIPSWLTYAPTVLELGGTISTYNTEAGLVRAALSPFSVSSEYQVELFIIPHEGAHWGRYQLFMSMNDTTPDINTEGVIVEITITGTSGAYTGRVVDITSGVGTITAITPGTIGDAKPFVLSAIRNGTNVKMYIDGVQVADVTVGAHSYKRVGFSMYATVASGVCFVNGFRIQYNEGLYTEIEKNILCAASNGIVYTNKQYINKMAAITSNLTLNTANLIHGTDRYQKLYIADYEDVKTKQTDGVISGTSLDSASISDWTTLGINKYDYVVVLTAGTGPTLGTYTIDTVAAGNLTLGSAPGNGSGISFYIQRAPKILDPIAGTLTLWTATTGSVPIGAFTVGLYRDRILMILDHLYFFSRQGDPLDWNYGATGTDVQRAISSQLSEAGIVGQIIKAAAIASDDLIIFFCNSSTWRLAGDPTYGGQLGNISKTIGCVDKGAYCFTSKTNIVFLSFDGIYTLDANSLATPTEISNGKLPTDLKAIDNKLHTVTMAYDVANRGIDIFITPKSGGLATHWWFDWENKSFWPVLIPVDQQPHSLLYYSDENEVFLGCKDGYIRCFDADAAKDDGTEFESYAVLGPMPLVKNDRNEGKMKEFTADVAVGSGSIDYDLHVGNSYESCLKSDPFMSGTWSTEGPNPKETPDAGGVCASFKISNGENLPWAIEYIRGVVEETGVQKVL